MKKTSFVKRYLNEVHAIDLRLFRRLNAARSPILDTLLPLASRAANHSLLWLGIAALISVNSQRGRRAAARGIFAVAVTSALANGPLKLLAQRARPDPTRMMTAAWSARQPSSFSFPSGHSASAFAFVTAASADKPRLLLPLATVASVVAYSRIYCGVHYPSDVLAGAAIGLVIGRVTRSLPPPSRVNLT